MHLITSSRIVTLAHREIRPTWKWEVRKMQGAIFSRPPRMVEVQKTQEQFSARPSMDIKKPSEEGLLLKHLLLYYLIIQA